MADRSFQPETLAIHAGQIPDAADRRARAADLPDHELRLRFSADHAASLFNLQTFGNVYSRLSQPDGGGARGARRRARRRPRGGGLGQRHGGRGDGADDDAAAGRPRGRGRRAVRRHGDACWRSTSTKFGIETHLRRCHHARGLRRRDAAEHARGVRREPRQPEPGGARHRRGRRGRACARRAAGDRQHGAVARSCATRSASAPTSSCTRPPSTSAATAPRSAA